MNSLNMAIIEIKNKERTLKEQIQKVAKRFRCEKVTFVGDKGMIKSGGIKDLEDESFHYITTITKPQMEKLIERDIIQLNLFATELMEVEDEGIRYIFRRNPYRAKEIEETRESKIERILKLIEKENTRTKTKMESKIERVKGKIQDLQIHKFIELKVVGNQISIEIDQEKKKEVSKLDGCFVIKTDLKEESKETIHSRYKDLAEVEYAFSTLKTGHLEIRPLYLRKESRTRGHLFVSMLGYMVVKELKKRTKSLGYTVEEIIESLGRINEVKLNVSGMESKTRISQPKKNIQRILEKLGIKLPTNL